jgi:aldehyde dehydrogenase (NAD+)
MTTQYKNLINGQLVDNGKWIDVVNPATEQVIGQVPDCGQADLDKAVAAARAAFQTWKKTSVEERRALFAKMADVIKTNSDELMRLLTAEQGKPHMQAGSEIAGCVGMTRALPMLNLEEKITEDSDKRLSRTRRVPVGVVGGIVPWNFPVLMAIQKIVPALLSGCTMVLKPSPFTPLATLRLAELVAGIFPPGVLNIITGGDLKRITLELGGNDAAIVLPDADVTKVAEKLFWASFYNAGQVCIAAKRIYIHEDIYDELSGAIAAYAKAVKVGDGAEQGTAIGPIQNKPQYKRVLELIQDAKDKGYKFLAGGDHDPSIPGYFVPVTVLDNPPEDARIVAEEQFGPVMPLMKFSTINEVISRANASDYGLAGSIWTSNPEAAVEVAEQLETGTVWINESMHLAPNAPFAGHKQSGFGAELGEEGLLEFTYPQVITIAREAA